MLIRCFVICLLVPGGFVANAADEGPLLVSAGDGTSLQAVLHQHGGTGQHLKLRETRTLNCPVQELEIEGEVSRHALLIPPTVKLDLNGSTLELDLRQNSHGVRLCSHSTISNGTIRIIRSEQKGSQAIWHSAISVGAPYDDGGTPQKPSYFSRVSHWRIQNITIDQPFPAAAIQLMSEACHGEIRDIRILDSAEALMGIGMDWGSVGKADTADEKIAVMRAMWDAGQLYTTHPHDITIEDVTIGRLTRNVDSNDAGIRCSACYNIHIRNVEVEAAAAAVAIFGGDCGFEFAPTELRSRAHTDYQIENVSMKEAFRCGIVLNGLADNVFRACQNHGYRPLLDPAQPGLNRVTISQSQFTGSRAPDTLGAFITAVSDVRFQNVTLQNFGKGVRIKDWIQGLRFTHCNLENNDQPRSISGTEQQPEGVIFE